MNSSDFRVFHGLNELSISWWNKRSKVNDEGIANEHNERWLIERNHMIVVPFYKPIKVKKFILS